MQLTGTAVRGSRHVQVLWRTSGRKSPLNCFAETSIDAFIVHRNNSIVLRHFLTAIRASCAHIHSSKQTGTK